MQFDCKESQIKHVLKTLCMRRFLCLFFCVITVVCYVELIDIQRSQENFLFTLF